MRPPHRWAGVGVRGRLEGLASTLPCLLPATIMGLEARFSAWKAGNTQTTLGVGSVPGKIKKWKSHLMLGRFVGDAAG